MWRGGAIKEKDIQGKFTKYITKHLPKESIAWELKFVNLQKEKSKPFNCVDTEQIARLLEVEGDGCYWKIPDMASKFGGSGKKPFDCFCIKGKGYIVPCFYVERKRKTCYLIRVSKWIEMQNSCGRKSFTEEMCKSITEGVINL